MLDALLGALVLVLLAVLGSRFSFSTARVRGGPRLLLRTGIHFLVVGFLLGPEALGVVREASVPVLVPAVAVALGWVGLHFGLQLDLRTLRRFPATRHLFGVGQALLTFLLFLGGGWLLLGAAGIRAEVPVPLLAGAAAIAAVTTPAGVAVVSSNFLVRGNVRDLLLFTASLDAGVGIATLALVHGLVGSTDAGPETGPAMGAALVLVAAAAAVGALCGMVLLRLTRTRPARGELLLYLLGTCAFAAAATLQWDLSPLLVGLVTGAMVANLHPERQRVFAVVERWEKPVYLGFLLLAGALLAVPTPGVLALALGYALLRAAAKTTAAAALVSALPLGFRPPRRLGLGLLPQGGIPVAMAVSGVLLHEELRLSGIDGDPILFTVVVAGILLSELVGPRLTLHVLRNAGEVSPGVEEALDRGDERAAERAALRHGSNRDGSEEDSS